MTIELDPAMRLEGLEFDAEDEVGPEPDGDEPVRQRKRAEEAPILPSTFDHFARNGSLWS